jgi:hypothetical protein
LLGFFILLLSLSAVHAQISSSFSKGELSHLEHLSRNVMKNSHSLREIYHAVFIQSTAGSKQVSCNCQTMKSLLEKAQNAYDIHFGLSSDSICGCGLKAPSHAATLVTKSLAVRDDIF